jgi:hypothetical protein
VADKERDATQLGEEEILGDESDRQRTEPIALYFHNRAGGGEEVVSCDSIREKVYQFKGQINMTKWICLK